jgi:hypothetical protein
MAHERRSPCEITFCTSPSAKYPIYCGGQTLYVSCAADALMRRLALSTKAKSKAKRGSHATNGCIITAGEIFADGAMIELIAGSSGLNKPELLLWKGSRATVGPRVERGGCIYEAPDLAPSLYRAMRLPSHCIGYGSARTLFASIGDLFTHHFDLPERESSLLACFAISTWLAEKISNNLYNLWLMSTTLNLDAAFSALADPTREVLAGAEQPKIKRGEKR